MADTVTPKDLLDKAKSYADPQSRDHVVIKARGTAAGAVTGMAAGAMIGWYKGYNVYLSALVGIIGGGLISNFFINYKK